MSITTWLQGDYLNKTSKVNTAANPKYMETRSKRIGD